jgi:hypothetical protein
MSPPPPIQAVKPVLNRPLGRLHRFAKMSFLTSLAWSFFAASPGLADEPAKAEPPRPENAAKISGKNLPPSPLPPQTRYTVRKQIESIEPIAWLERYGTVRIRELDR